MLCIYVVLSLNQVLLGYHNILKLYIYEVINHEYYLGATAS